MVLALLSVKGTKMCAIRHNSPCANVRQLFVSRREETLSTNSECWYLVPLGCLRADGGRETWQNSGFKETEGLGTGEQVCSEKNISTSKCQRWKNVHAGVDLSPYHWKQRNLKYAHSHQCFVSFLLHFLSSPNHTHTHARRWTSQVKDNLAVPSLWTGGPTCRSLQQNSVCAKMYAHNVHTKFMHPQPVCQLAC